MKILKTFAAAMAAAMALGFIFLPVSPATAQTPGLRVLSANAVQAALTAMQPQCEQAVGRPLQIQYETSAGIKRAVDTGTAAFDVLILNAESMDAMVRDGKVTANSRVDIGRTTLGVGVRAGTPAPDVSTAASLKKTLLAAGMIAYPKEGSSTPYILKLFDRLGIAEQLKSKAMPEISTRDAVVHVLDGKADLFVSLLSEIIPAKGIQFAGRVPDEFQGDLRFSAGIGIGTAAADVPSAQALIRFLTSPAMLAALQAQGMDPVKK